MPRPEVYSLVYSSVLGRACYNFLMSTQAELLPDEPRRTLDDLVARALAYRTGEELQALLTFAHRFPHVAPFNAMLLHVQNPGIRYALRAAA